MILVFAHGKLTLAPLLMSFLNLHLTTLNLRQNFRISHSKSPIPHPISVSFSGKQSLGKYSWNHQNGTCAKSSLLKNIIMYFSAKCTSPSVKVLYLLTTNTDIIEGIFMWDFSKRYFTKVHHTHIHFIF